MTWRADRRLRLLLVVAGLAGVVGSGVGFLMSGSTLSLHLITLGGLGGAGLVLAAVFGLLGPRMSALIAVVLGAGAGAFLVGAHRISALPLVDGVVPLGIGQPRWLYIVGIYLLAFAASPTLAMGSALRTGRGSRAIRRGKARPGRGLLALLCIAGSGLYTAYWVKDQTFYDEVVDYHRAGDMPVAVHGALEHHPWDRALTFGLPVARLPAIIQNEGVRSDVAQGLVLETSGTGLVEGALWGAQKWLVTALIALEGALLLLAPALGLLALVGVDPGPLARRALGWLILAVTTLPPAINLIFIAILTLSGQGGGELGEAVADNAGLLAVFLTALLGGRVLSGEES